jgi:DNA-binding LytR/AlgR family response regulator
MTKYNASAEFELEWQIEVSSNDLYQKLQTQAGIQSLKDIALFVFDVEMPQVNGITLAKLIRAVYPDVFIVYITGFRDYAYEAFGVTALDYLLKPLIYENFEKMLTKAIFQIELQREKQKQSLKFKSKMESFSIPCDQIYYLEKVLRKVRIVHSKGENEVYLSNKEIENLLEPFSFVRCHQSYYVNLDKVSYYRNQSLYINKLNAFLPVSKAYIKTVKDAVFSAQTK